MQAAEAVADLKDQPTPHRQLLLKRYVSRWGGLDDAGLRNCLAQSVAKAKELGQLFSVPLPGAAEMQHLVESLAMASGTPLPPGSAPEDEGPPLPRRSIVALDDDPIVLELIEAWLEGTEFDVVTGSRPDDVWEQSRSADAILCDLHLEQTQGTEVLRRPRLDGIHAPLLMFSSDRTRGSVANSIQAGACDYVLKPLSRETLLGKLRHQIARHTSCCPD